LNVLEAFTIDVVCGARRTKEHYQHGVAAEFDNPVDNIGAKGIGSATGYANYANQRIRSVTIPRCAAPVRVFVGRRNEPFYIAVGKSFDLFKPEPGWARRWPGTTLPGGQERQHARDRGSDRLLDRRHRTGDRCLHHC
jgi:hypothetical protein